MIVTDRFRDGDPTNDLDAIPGRPDWWQGGDLRGVIDELDHIRSLGMTAIWITPVALQTRGGYHGYWTLDPYRIDPHLGDMATLKELVATAHRKGLKVVLDIVLNHVGYGHPWLSERPEWFHPRCTVLFSDQRSVEDCWLAGLPDLNTEDLAVRQYLIDWSTWLLRETDVDGLRLDAARHLPLAFIRDWSAAMRREHSGVWLVGEVFSADHAYQAPYLAAGLDAVADFRTQEDVQRGLSFRGDLARLVEMVDDPGALPPGARATFIDEHDLPRFVGSGPTTAEQRARLVQAIAYLFTMPGIPVLYYGTEVALPGGADSDDRRPMPWGVRFWDRAADGADVLAATRALATARRDHPVLRAGGLVVLDASATELAYARVLGGDAAVIVMNGDATASRKIAVDVRSIVAGTSSIRPVLAGPRGDLRDRTLTVTLPARGVQVWLFEPR